MMAVPARIVYGGYTDTPGLSPAVSWCIRGLFTDVLEYSRFLYGDATVGMTSSR